MRARVNHANIRGGFGKGREMSSRDLCRFPSPDVARAEGYTRASNVGAPFLVQGLLSPRDKP
jgi:hypothetical protein